MKKVLARAAVDRREILTTSREALQAAFTARARPISVSFAILEAIAMSDASSARPDLYAAFVGRNYVYYRRKWDSMDRRQSALSFNGAALFYCPFWLLYRKRYHASVVISWVYWGIVHYAGPLRLGSFELGGNTVCGLAYLLASVISGLFSNAYYRRVADHNIRQYRDSLKTQEEVAKELSLRGGVTIAPFVILLALLALVLAWLAYRVLR